MELRAYASYSELDYNINYWRTKTGLEVDFIIGQGHTAIELKGSSRIDSRSLRGLKTFMDDFDPKNAIVVCNETAERVIEDIRVTPWNVFLSRLWAGEIIS